MVRTPGSLSRYVLKGIDIGNLQIFPSLFQEAGDPGQKRHPAAKLCDVWEGHVTTGISTAGMLDFYFTSNIFFTCVYVPAVSR